MQNGPRERRPLNCWLSRQHLNHLWVVGSDPTGLCERLPWRPFSASLESSIILRTTSWPSGKTIRLPGRPPCLPPKTPNRSGMTYRRSSSSSPSPPAAPVTRPDTGLPRKESLIAADITIEGKIEGGGSVRIAGKFQGRRQRPGRSHHRDRRQADRRRARRQGHDRRRTGRKCRGSLARRSAGDRRGDRRPEGRFADGRGRRPHARQGRVRLGRRQGLESRQARRTARRRGARS